MDANAINAKRDLDDYMDDTLPAMRIKIREMRERAGLSRGELAKRAYVSKESIYIWEKGKVVPLLINAALIARALGVTLDELVEWENREGG